MTTTARESRAKLAPRLVWPSAPASVEAPPARRPVSKPRGFGFALALAAGLAWAPFWLGGARPFAWGCDAIVFPGLLIAREAALAWRGEPIAVIPRAPLALLLVVVAGVALQVSPGAPHALAHPVWATASDALGTPLAATVSVDPATSEIALARLLAEASVFWLALQLGAVPAFGLFLLRAAAFTVTAYCAYGLALAAFAGGAIPGLAPASGDTFVRSTFVNRNSFSTYAGLGLVALAGLGLRLARRAEFASGGRAGLRWSRLAEALGAEGLALAGAALVVAAALAGSASRGGIASAAAGLLALGALSLARRRRRETRASTFATLGAAFAALAAGFGADVMRRLAEAGLGDANRLAVDRIALGAIAEAPWTGFGYGGFADVFPLYRDGSLPSAGVWDMAHNAYLEVGLGLGLVCGGALTAALVFVAARCAAAALIRRRAVTAPAVAAAASALVGLHAAVDFSLEIDAVALTYMALLGVGFAQAVPPSPRFAKAAPPSPRFVQAIPPSPTHAAAPAR